MNKQSAGILLYRRIDRRVEVLLVHPGGPFFAKKDFGVWSLPKGEFEEQEAAVQAALREFSEETGVTLPGKELIPLTALRQKSGKIVHAWAMEHDLDAGQAHSNPFELEWPPGTGRFQQFPEVDRAAWFPLDEARQKINPGQAAFLDELVKKLSAKS